MSLDDIERLKSTGHCLKDGLEGLLYCGGAYGYSQVNFNVGKFKVGK